MADTINRLAGLAFVSVDGKTYQLAGELSYSPVRVVRETQVGQDHVHGFKEMPAASFIKGKFRDGGGLTIADFNAMDDVTVHLELANGKTVTGRNMWSVEALEVDTTEGTVEVRWEGFDGAVVEN